MSMSSQSSLWVGFTRLKNDGINGTKPGDLLVAIGAVSLGLTSHDTETIRHVSPSESEMPSSPLESCLERTQWERRNSSRVN